MGCRAVAGCVLTVACVAVACGAPNGTERADRRPTTATGTPAEAETPASGVCAPKPDGPDVVVVLTVDAPTPRCVVVGPEQHLRIENQADATTVTLAHALSRSATLCAWTSKWW